VSRSKAGGPVQLLSTRAKKEHATRRPLLKIQSTSPPSNALVFAGYGPTAHG
jgi:hypothetical protein